jgi:hypothetical protein
MEFWQKKGHQTICRSGRRLCAGREWLIHSVTGMKRGARNW